MATATAPTTPTPSRPSTPPPPPADGPSTRTATVVTFDPPEHPALLSVSRRASTIGHNPYADGAYSVSASARTSYTRVDELMGDETPVPAPSQVAQVNRAEDHTDNIPHTPQICLTFLLASGRRRSPMNFDPTHTVGRVKELVWNTWPADWQDERPPTPSFLRLLYLGKVLEDEAFLKESAFPIDAPPTVVHMSIRPGALADDMNKKGEEEVVCCCIIC